jgi:hypothetical protein
MLLLLLQSGDGGGVIVPVVAAGKTTLYAVAESFTIKAPQQRFTLRGR